MEMPIELSLDSDEVGENFLNQVFIPFPYFTWK